MEVGTGEWSPIKGNKKRQTTQSQQYNKYKAYWEKITNKKEYFSQLVLATGKKFWSLLAQLDGLCMYIHIEKYKIYIHNIY